YLERLRAASSKGVARSVLGCANLAHGFAVCSPSDKDALAAWFRAFDDAIGDRRNACVRGHGKSLPCSLSLSVSAALA
ncbi:hypothetical protein AB9F34_34280, partial [Rhizobium leguminosarum]|uniref:hypothetical protein n=1 Tax=Rhizobium leguminosarum TaxID=384 RepID=UPI003F9A8F59